MVEAIRDTRPAHGKALSLATRNEYLSTLRKWERWGGGIAVEQLRRKDIREFLDWVYEQAVKGEGENSGRTSNKAREHLRAMVGQSVRPGRGYGLAGARAAGIARSHVSR
jgi:hypothetical protein